MLKYVDFIQTFEWQNIGYANLMNAAQQQILGTLEFMTGLDLMRYPHGIDGCGAPSSLRLSAIGLGRLLYLLVVVIYQTRGMRRVKGYAEHCRRAIVRCGPRKACGAINAAYGETITVKTGAEGVYSAAFHELGLGAAVKARDGNKRGAEVAIGAVIGL